MLIGVSVFLGACSGYLERVDRINAVSKEIELRVENTKKLQKDLSWDYQNDVLYLPCYDTRDVLYEGRPDLNEYYMWNFCIANDLEKETIVSTINQ